MKALKKILRKQNKLQIITAIIWAAMMIGYSFVFRANESSGLILLTWAAMYTLLFSRSTTVKSKCNKANVV